MEMKIEMLRMLAARTGTGARKKVVDLLTAAGKAGTGPRRSFGAAWGSIQAPRLRWKCYMSYRRPTYADRGSPGATMWPAINSGYARSKMLLTPTSSTAAGVTCARALRCIKP